MIYWKQGPKMTPQFNVRAEASQNLPLNFAIRQQQITLNRIRRGICQTLNESYQLVG